MMRLIRHALVAAACLAVAACAEPAEVTAALGPEPTGTDYPALLPWQDIAALDSGVAESERAAAAALQARGARLQRDAQAIAD